MTVTAPLRIIFCADPLRPRYPDPAFADEVAAAETAGCGYDMIDFEALVNDDDPGRAVRRMTAQPALVLACYRGWMLKPAQYRRLYDALHTRGVRLLNDPGAYSLCHHLPEIYPLLAGRTPRTVWLTLDQESRIAPPMDTIMALLRTFGEHPIIVKDFVKSRKYEWDDACYIPSAADRGAVERVTRRFLQLQGDDLNEGLVFREFIALERGESELLAGLPTTREYRLFFLDGEFMFSAAQSTVSAAADLPPDGLFGELAQRIESRFFTLDVARDRAGDWLIIEAGDAQVSGIPEGADYEDFYRRLAGRCLPFARLANRDNQR